MAPITDNCFRENTMKNFSLFYRLAFITFLVFFSKISYSNNFDSSAAEKLIKQCIQSSGGEDALMNMQSISRYGRITINENKTKNNFCYHTDIIYPIKLREQIKRDGKKIMYDRGTDKTSFWMWNGSKYEYIVDRQLTDGRGDKTNAKIVRNITVKIIGKNKE